MNKDEVIALLEEAALSDIEVIREEEGMCLVRFRYDFDEDELSAAENFAVHEATAENGGPFEELAEEPVALEEIAEAEEAAVEDEEDEEMDLDLEEEADTYLEPHLMYLSEIAIDQVGETLEEIRDELDLEVQYVGYDMDESVEPVNSYEFAAMFAEPDSGYNIEDLLDETELEI